ncbi:MAG: GNAT family N-acetyltransferase [Spirochaetales bacterium]|nr:GNAT family N-acetyltransferase [Spirochaetales bacterium]
MENGRFKKSIAEIDRDQWNIVLNTGGFPLLSWDWLEVLESSRSITPDTGWDIRHLALSEGPDLKAALPLYIRRQSWGEFVFDFELAEICQKYGLPWYPKLVSMSPVSPCAGFNLFDGDPAQVNNVLKYIYDFCLDEKITSFQINFFHPEDASVLSAWKDFIPWHHVAFRWDNPGYRDFQDYLDGFRKNQRRNIRRERQSVADRNIRSEVFAGFRIPDSFFPLMYQYYLRTNEKFGPWAALFLNEKFFLDLGKVKDILVFGAAFSGDDPEPIALSFLLRGEDNLYGRYWGCHEDIKDLYFEVCYYSIIEWAIANGIRYFDPGAGSPLKVRRGFIPTRIVSLHKFYDPLTEAVFRQVAAIYNKGVEEDIKSLGEWVPLKARE